MDISKRKEFLRKWHAKNVALLGYKFTLDEEMIDFLLEQQVLLERKHGSPFCPCQGISGIREQDMKIVCPCIPYHRRHFAMMQQCWCGLFIHQDVSDTSKLGQIPAGET